jgi:hypothetical protein
MEDALGGENEIALVGRYIERALADIFAIHVGAVTAPQVADVQSRWIDLETAVMPGNVGVFIVGRKADIAIARPANDTLSRPVEQVFGFGQAGVTNCQNDS